MLPKIQKDHWGLMQAKKFKKQPLNLLEQNTALQIKDSNEILKGVTKVHVSYHSNSNVY